MGKTRCKECGEEVRDEDVFHHHGKRFCPECVKALLQSKYAAETARAARGM